MPLIHILYLFLVSPTYSQQATKRYTTAQATLSSCVVLLNNIIVPVGVSQIFGCYI